MGYEENTAALPLLQVSIHLAGRIISTNPMVMPSLNLRPFCCAARRKGLWFRLGHALIESFPLAMRHKLLAFLIHLVVRCYKTLGIY